jgi:hypothetical protein
MLVNTTKRNSVNFSSPVFFIKQLLLVLIGMPRNDFKFFRIFVELIVFVIVPHHGSRDLDVVLVRRTISVGKTRGVGNLEWG